MNINVIGRQLEITPAIKTYTENRLQAFSIFSTIKINSIHATLEYSKGHFQVGLVLNCKYHTLKAEVESLDLYRSFDAAVDKVGHQLYVLTDRVRDHRGVALRDLEGTYAETLAAGEE